MNKEKKSVKSLKMFLNKDKDLLVINPEVTDQRKPMGEEKEVHGVMAFGRMNPPTTGHAALVDKMHEVAKQHKASHVLVASHTQDKKKNPLSGEEKVKHLKRYFPDTHIELASKEHPTFLQHAAKLHKQGVTHLHMIAGSDRVKEYHEKLHQYNGTGEGKLYSFKHITVHSAGHRDPDAEGTEGMSASKMREHAASNNYKEFKKGIPKHVSSEHAKELFHDTRKGMQLKEEQELDEAVLDIANRRKRGMKLRQRHSRMERQKQIALKRFANDLKLRRRARNVARALVRRRVAGARGANYTHLSTNDKIAVDKMIQGKERLIKSLAGKLYQRIRKREADRVVRVRAGMPAKRQGKIINAEFDFSVFSSLYDSLVENKFTISEKELFDLKAKATKYDLPFESLEEVYRNAALSYNDSDKTLQQHCFDAVNAYIAEVSKTDQSSIKGHLQAATKQQQQGKYKKAAVHRKIASALQRGDHTTAQGLQQQLSSINESFIVDRASGIGVMYTAADLGIKTQGGFAHHPSVLEELIARGELEGDELEKAIEEMRKCNYKLKKMRRPNE